MYYTIKPFYHSRISRLVLSDFICRPIAQDHRVMSTLLIWDVLIAKGPPLEVVSVSGPALA